MHVNYVRIEEMAFGFYVEAHICGEEEEPYAYGLICFCSLFCVVIATKRGATRDLTNTMVYM